MKRYDFCERCGRADDLSRAEDERMDPATGYTDRLWLCDDCLQMMTGYVATVRSGR